MNYVMTIGLLVLIGVGFLIYTLKNLLYVATPSEVLILAGNRYMLGHKTIGYRSICGGRVVRVPLFEAIYRMDLSNIPLEIVVKHAYSAGGIPLNVHGIAHVKLPSTEPRLSNAVERFLGRSREEIAQIARETLEGNVRGVLAKLTPEDVNSNKVAFQGQLLHEAEHDFERLGLVLDTLKIQNVTDDSNYFNSIGRIRGAGLQRDASIAEANAQSQAACQKAHNWCQSELATIRANLAIASKETERRIKDAITGRKANIAKIEGDIRAEIAMVDEDIRRQQARAIQTERQLDADVVQPWFAEKRKLEENARAQAASVTERGRAEALALGKLAAEYAAAGPAARELLVLQQLMPMVRTIAGAERHTKIREWTVLDSGDGDGLATKAIRLNEQLRAATGVDLVKAAGRLGGVEPVKSPAPAPKS
ncbi:MAG: flotillin family protein [Myxococcales bacterium]|nr:flotillin family protein [Myxococcales bacterium]